MLMFSSIAVIRDHKMCLVASRFRTVKMEMVKMKQLNAFFAHLVFLRIGYDFFLSEKDKWT